MADERPYAEVIGDPVAHSLSPYIHRHWLTAHGLPDDYRASRCTQNDLPALIAARRSDPLWRGCSVTMPLKAAVLPLLDTLSPQSAATGAANCVVPKDGGLAGFNTDIDGVAAALGERKIRNAVVLGAGGAARAAIEALKPHQARITLVVRDPARIARTEQNLAAVGYDRAPAALNGADLVVNATPLGMAGAPPMPLLILDSLAAAAPGALALDMVYRPLKTDFLAAAEAARLATSDGLVMLIGQARRAFTLFFGAAPPRDDAALRAGLIAGAAFP